MEIALKGGCCHYAAPHGALRDFPNYSGLVKLVFKYLLAQFIASLGRTG